jgi:hypothetical protein
VNLFCCVRPDFGITRRGAVIEMTRQKLTKKKNLGRAVIFDDVQVEFKPNIKLTSYEYMRAQP